MGYSRKRIKEVADVKRAAVERIRAAIGLIDTSRSLKYIEDFTTEFSSFQNVCNPAEILDKAADSNLIWVADYHSLSRFQEFAATFIRNLHQRSSNIALGVECVFARHQKLLDNWMSGRISEQAFLEKIRYAEDWGCDWQSYSVLFHTARELGIPVYGVDCPPRYDMRSIGRRDQGAARRIAGIVERDPSRTLVVVFGESHLASNHLPHRVRTTLADRGIGRQEMVILQNVDEMYWRLQKRGLENVRSVRLSGDRHYCVFNATPIEKYESFRQYLHQCINEDAAGVWTNYVHTLIDITMEFVDLKRDGSVTALPKVYSGISSSRFPQILARLSVPADLVAQILEHLKENGSSYVPALNSIFIHRLQLTSATEESTRFIHRLCRGDLPVSAIRLAGDQFFVTVIERALGYFSSKLLDSSRDGIEALSKQVLREIGYNEDLRAAVASFMSPTQHPAARHFEALSLAIGTGMQPGRTTQMLGQLLGYVLGQKLYGAYLETRISRRDLRFLFRDRMDGPNRPLATYRDLTRRLS